MKHFIVDLTKNKSSYNEDSINILKSKLADNLFGKYPFLSGSESNIFGGVKLKAAKPAPIMFSMHEPTFGSYKPTTIKSGGRTFLNFGCNGCSVTHDDWDFEIDGTPVKFYDRFVQVGYDIIPIEMFPPMEMFLNNNRTIVNKEAINIIINITLMKKKSLF